MPPTSQAHLRQFPTYEPPTAPVAPIARVTPVAPFARPVHRATRKMPTAPASRGGATPPPKKEAGSSGVRAKVTSLTCDQLERMASFVSLYTNLRRELDNVLDPARVLVLTGRVPEELDAHDPDLTCMLRLVNGVSSVDDVIQSSGMDRAHAVSVLCTLIVARTITFV